MKQQYSEAWCLFCNKIVSMDDYYNHMDNHYKNGELDNRDGSDIIDQNNYDTSDYQMEQLKPWLINDIDDIWGDLNE